MLAEFGSKLKYEYLVVAKDKLIFESKIIERKYSSLFTLFARNIKEK